MRVYQCGDSMSTLRWMWLGGALIQVSTLCCYFEVSLGYLKKSKRRLEWDVDVCVMYRLDFYLHVLLSCSSSERERDVGRISEKQR